MANTLLIEGSFEELCDELAVYIDGLAGSQVQAEVAPLLKEDNKVDALKKVVTASAALNKAPERGEFLYFDSLFFSFLVSSCFVIFGVLVFVLWLFGLFVLSILPLLF